MSFLDTALGFIGDNPSLIGGILGAGAGLIGGTGDPATVTPQYPTAWGPVADVAAANALDLFGLPTPSYGGPLTAQFNPALGTVGAGLEGIMAAGAPPELGFAGQRATQAAGFTSGFDPAAGGPTSAEGAAQSGLMGIAGSNWPSSAGAYMNPFIENVLNVQKNRAMQRFNEQQTGRDAAAVQSSAFGNNRRYTADSLAQRDLNEQLDAIDAGGLERAYTTGAGIFDRDMSRQAGAYSSLGGLGGQLGSRGLEAAAIGDRSRLAAETLGLESAAALTDIARTGQDMGLERAQGLFDFGQYVQDYDQGAIDRAVADYYGAAAFPYERAASIGALIPSPTGSVQYPAQAPFSTRLIGGALAGAGIGGRLS